MAHLRIGIKNIAHPFREIGFVAGQLDKPSRLQAGNQQFSKILLYDTAFVMFGFGPRIGMVDKNTIELPFGHLMLQHELRRQLRDSCTLNKARIIKSPHRLGDARQVDFRTKEEPVRMGFSQMHKKITVAEADLHDNGCPGWDVCLSQSFILRQTDQRQPFDQARLLTNSHKAVFSPMSTQFLLAELISEFF